MRYFIPFIAIMMMSSCASSKANSNENMNRTVQEEAEITTYYFTVSFVSIGEGIDINAKKNFDDFITYFEENKDIELDFEMISWGREGEVDYCFQLDKSASTHTQFLKDAKQNLKASKLVRFMDKEMCRETIN